LEPGLHEYAAKVKEVLDPVWQNDMPWVHKWLTTDPQYQQCLDRDGDAEDIIRREIEESTTAKVVARV
jgi:hypothetical protein